MVKRKKRSTSNKTMQRDYRITSLTWTSRKLEVTALSVLLNFPINLTREIKFLECRQCYMLPLGVQARGVLQEKYAKIRSWNLPRQNSFSLRLAWVFIATICDLLKESDATFLTNQRQYQNNLWLACTCFPRLIPATCILSDFWLVHWIFGDICDWAKC